MRCQQWDSIVLPFPALSFPEAALILVLTKRSVASGGENAFPVMKLYLYSACSSGGGGDSVWQTGSMYFCDVCPVHHIWINYFVIYMIYELSSARVLSGVCWNFVGLFYISSQEKSFLATPNVENECWTLYETLESSGKMKLMMEFCLCLHKISELWNLFSLVPMRNCFRCYFKQLFMYLALRRRKNDCKILKIALVQIFVH